MVDKLKEIPKRIWDWWNHFTSKQKTIIIGLSASVIFALAILVFVTSRPQYKDLISCETTAQAAEIVEVLEGAGIQHKVSTNGLEITVETSQESVARLALGSAGFVSDAYSPEEALAGGLTSTAADKEKLWGVYLQSQFESDLAALNNVKSAKVRFYIPDRDGTLSSKREEASAYIQLELDGTFTSANAANVAKAAASFLGNSSTAEITIVDFDANLLFAGGDDYTIAGVANSLQELQNQAELTVENQVKRVLLGTNQYSNVEVTGHLRMDYASYQETVKEYYANDDRTEGMKAHEELFESENTNDGGGIPGTDSNGEAGNITYVDPDYGGSSSTQTESVTDYLPNESSVYKELAAGSIDYNASSISIATITYKEYREEEVKAQGLLKEMSWEEYKLANGDDVKREVDEEFYKMVANATGIPEDKITIVSYISPLFYDKAGVGFGWTDVASIIMLVLIIGLLAFVVFRSMRATIEVTEEEELSVENLLQSTPEETLDDIDLEAKSATRKLIEKFVDENPESAASLLRNWLNEDWG